MLEERSFVLCRWMSVSHKHVIVMISFVQKPEEGKEEARWMTSYLHPWAHQILNSKHMVAHPWLPCNSLRCNAKCVVYSGSPFLLHPIHGYFRMMSWLTQVSVFGLGLVVQLLESTLGGLLLREGQVQSRVGRLLTFKLVIKPVIKNNLPVGYWFVL